MKKRENIACDDWYCRDDKDEGICERCGNCYDAHIERYRIDFVSNEYKMFDTYFSSKEWYYLKREVLERDNYTCQLCGKIAQVVHHFYPKHIGEEYVFELVSLCNKCHKIYHPGEKLTL